MNNDKAQMLNKAQNPNDKYEWFWHSGIWISAVIWILTFGLVPTLRRMLDEIGIYTLGIRISRLAAGIAAHYWNWRHILSYNMANVDEVFWTSVRLFRLRS